MPRRPAEQFDDGGDYFDEGWEWACSHCCGDGECTEGADPLGDCPEEPHRCHACNGSGRAKDQVIW